MVSMLFGVLGIGANIVIYQQNSGKKLLLYKMVSDVLWALHYFSLYATSAGAIALIGLCREFVFFNQNKKWAKSNWWLVLFIMCSVASAVLTWKSIFSVLPAVASVISIISFWKNKPKLSRILAFPISTAMMTYDFYCLSFMGIVSECFTIFSSVVGIIRYSKNKN